jgi:hypothetical protein
MHPLLFTLIIDSFLLDIWFPLPISGRFGVAYIVTKLRPLATNLTFRHHNTSSMLLMNATSAMIPQIDDSGNQDVGDLTIWFGSQHSACSEA